MNWSRGRDKDGVDRRIIDQVRRALAGQRPDFAGQSGRSVAIDIEDGVHASTRNLCR